MGDPNHPAVLLVMGLGAQLLLWRKEFCEKLVDQGLRVIRYDNRDVGLSTKVTGQHTGASLAPRMVRSFLGMRNPAVYTLEDVADDAAALLDHLKIDTAHIVGASMGGMIAQVFAARHKVRTKTLAVIFSSNNQPLLPPPGPKQLLAILQKPKDSTREAIVENAIRVTRITGSPGYPAPEERIRAEALEGYDRSYYPAGAEGPRPALPPRGRGPPLRRDSRHRQPARLQPADQRPDRGDPRKGGQADAAVRRARDRPRHQGCPAGAVRRHGARPAPRAVGRHRGGTQDELCRDRVGPAAERLKSLAISTAA